MSARRLMVYNLFVETEEAHYRNLERQERQMRRQFNSPSRISDTHFRERYRLSREAYRYLCDLLRDNTELRSSQRVSLKTKVLCTLLFYANGDYQRVVGIANAFSQEAISKFVSQVTEALNHPNIIRKIIKFPSTREARNAVKQKFYNHYGIPGVIGCVDGCHFKIFKPKKEVENLYYCRKHYHSLNVQMVVDHDSKILAINPKFGGKSHDAFIWENSQINSYIQTLHQSGESVWLLGDSGYPQRPWLMTPYHNPTQGTAAESYNTVHSKARVIVENTFGRLKNRWRCLCKDRTLHYAPDKCAKIIIACSVLHNIGLEYGVETPEDQLIDYEDFHRAEAPPNDNAPLLTLGRLIRDEVAEIVHQI